MSDSPSLSPLGIMNQMWAATAISDEEAIATALEEIRVADALGFDSVWIGEHHGSRPDAPFHGRIPAPEIMLAHLGRGVLPRLEAAGVRAPHRPAFPIDRLAVAQAKIDVVVIGNN